MLAALGALATNIVLPAFPAFPAMGEYLRVSVLELSATLTSFFLAFGRWANRGGKLHARDSK
ncbi:hypothetical protein [Pseudomonas sp. ML2-2023-3]|uniref:hypothetical protein n=1 Tax=Pseudomonas sp. ML2-2023-3 TaxID=3122375 RepID=UPI0030CB2802